MGKNPNEGWSEAPRTGAVWSPQADAVPPHGAVPGGEILERGKGCPWLQPEGETAPRDFEGPLAPGPGLPMGVWHHLPSLWGGQQNTSAKCFQTQGLEAPQKR